MLNCPFSYHLRSQNGAFNSCFSFLLYYLNPFSVSSYLISDGYALLMLYKQGFGYLSGCLSTRGESSICYFLYPFISQPEEPWDLDELFRVNLNNKTMSREGHQCAYILYSHSILFSWYAMITDDGLRCVPGNFFKLCSLITTRT